MCEDVLMALTIRVALKKIIFIFFWKDLLIVIRTGLRALLLLLCIFLSAEGALTGRRALCREIKSI